MLICVCVSVCVWSSWRYFSIFIPKIKRDRTRPRAEKVVAMVHTSSDQTGAIVHTDRGGTNEAKHCGNTLGGSSSKAKLKRRET